MTGLKVERCGYCALIDCRCEAEELREQRDALAAEVERLREALDEAVDNCRLAQEAHNAAAARVAELEAQPGELHLVQIPEEEVTKFMREQEAEITRLRSLPMADPGKCWHCDERRQALEVSE